MLIVSVNGLFVSLNKRGHLCSLHHFGSHVFFIEITVKSPQWVFLRVNRISWSGWAIGVSGFKKPQLECLFAVSLFSPGAGQIMHPSCLIVCCLLTNRQMASGFNRVWKRCVSSERYNVLHNKNLETVKSLRYSILEHCSYMKYLWEVCFVFPVFALKRFNGSVDKHWVGTVAWCHILLQECG